MNEFERNDMNPENESIMDYSENKIPVSSFESNESRLDGGKRTTDATQQAEEPLKIRLEQSDQIPEEAVSQYIPGIVNQKPYYERINKKSKAKRYIAAGTAVAIINLVILSGLFGVGYSLGKKVDISGNQIAETLRDESNPKGSEETTSNTTKLGVGDSDLATTEIAKKVGPSVVGITSRIVGQISWFGTQSVSKGEGSGIIISSDGYIVTNNHVIENASEITVRLNTGTEVKATVKGTDSKTDLAVIKIEPTEQLTVAELGDSTQVEVGERAIAIGNPMGLEFFGSVTQGIISAVNRTITIDDNGSRTMNVIQTDAAINNGNSGGALVNGKGQVIGINAVKLSSTGVEGMGFAIPISEAKLVIADLLEYGYVKGRPVLGISARDVTDYMSRAQGWPKGVQVMAVSVGSGAEIAGLEQGDIITKVDGEIVETNDKLNEIKSKHAPGDVLQCEVYKYSTGLTQTVSVKLSEEKPTSVTAG